jgi:hypothetical protein
VFLNREPLPLTPNPSPPSTGERGERVRRERLHSKG